MANDALPKKRRGVFTESANIFATNVAINAFKLFLLRSVLQ
jgi:hypothetical protein